MPDILAHDWFRPRLAALLAEADTAGYTRDVSQAVITDLANGALGASARVKADDAWAQDIGEPDYMVNQPPAGGASGEVDFGGPGLNPLAHVGHGNRPV